MNISDLEKVNKICSERNSLISGIESINTENRKIIMTFLKSNIGPGAQVNILLTIDEVDFLKEILKKHVNNLNYELYQLGVGVE